MLQGLRFLRQRLLTKFILIWFKKILPNLSETEQIAIAAGDTWHEAGLFQGRPNWQSLLEQPAPQLSSAEQDFIDNEVEQLCGMLDDWEITHQLYDLPEQAWDFIKKLGFLGLHIPKEYGGLEFSALANSTIVMKIASKSISAAISVMVPNSLGAAELITNYGTVQQKQKYLPSLASGKQMSCFALTSPEAGSDAGAIVDTGEICYAEYNGKNILGIRLNWNKRYITLAPIATIIGLAIKLSDPEKILGGQQDLGISLVLVDANEPGVEIGRRHFPLNQAFLNGPIEGKNVFVPLDNLIGGKEQVGKGWLMLVESLASGRGISLPALATSAGKFCYNTTGTYSVERQQFRRSIGKFEGVASVLGRIGGFTYILEATRLLTLTAIDHHIKPAVITAIAKYHMTEISRVIVNDAMDVHGGKAIMMGPKNYLARIYQSIPISITVEGANILTRNLMIFGQGAFRCHPYVKDSIKAAYDPDPIQSLKLFDKFFWGHFTYTIRNFVRLIFHSVTFMYFCESPDVDIKWKSYYKKLSFFSIALACCSDTAMLVLGGNLKKCENISARLGDILSHLYLGSAVLKYYNDGDKTEAEQSYLQWSLDNSLYNINLAIKELFSNFPSKTIAFLLRIIILPRWREFKRSQDKISLNIASEMMNPTSVSKKITKDIVQHKDDNLIQVDSFTQEELKGSL